MHVKEQPQVATPFFAFTPLNRNIRRCNTCCRLLKTCARCFPTSAERFRQTHQGWSMTLAAASKDAGHVRAATIPARSNGAVMHEHACETTHNATSVLCACTWEHRVLESFLGNDANQPIQQRGHSGAQIPEEARLPHQAVLFTTAAPQATPWSLEAIWNTAFVFYGR